MPQGVNGLRKLRTTVVRHSPGQEKNCQRSLDGRTPSVLRIRGEVRTRFQRKSLSRQKKGDNRRVCAGNDVRRVLTPVRMLTRVLKNPKIRAGGRPWSGIDR